MVKLKNVKMYHIIYAKKYAIPINVSTMVQYETLSVISVDLLKPWRVKLGNSPSWPSATSSTSTYSKLHLCVQTWCVEMVFPIIRIVGARLLQLWAHKNDRKWNVKGYVLHLLRELLGCSWKNDLFVNQVHYSSSLEEKNVFLYFSPHINQ